MWWRLTKTAAFSVLVPGTVVLLIPHLLGNPADNRIVFPLLQAIVGDALFFVGLVICLWCAWEFAVKGLGTPAPIDAPKILVVQGLNRFTRNPMYVGVASMVAGQAIYRGSFAIAIYFSVVVTLFNLFVLLYEEPTLRRLFGEQYQTIAATFPAGLCASGVHDFSPAPWLDWPYMRFDLITIFPEFFSGPLDHGIVRRAKEAEIAQIQVQDLREFTKDRHRTVDDRPFGGGEGMVLKPEPLFEAVEKLLGHDVGDAEKRIGPEPGTAIVLMSAAGRLFNQEMARRYAKLEHMIVICGRYEGVDERIAEHLATEEVSVGDYVLSGGELAAAIVVDAVTRLLPGALGNEASTQNESFSELEAIGQPLAAAANAANRAGRLLLDYPHYTRPAEYRGWKVPEVLIGGHHAEVAKWRRVKALEKTRRNRPDLLEENG